MFAALCKSQGLPEPQPEFRFHPERKWRFDWAFPEHKVAVEVEGGAWIGGRHTSGSGFVADMLKYNAAVLLGWRVLRFLPKELDQAVSPLRLLILGSTEGKTNG